MSTQVLQRPALREGAFGNATHLSCRECGATHVLGPFYACPECFGPLEIAYDFPQVTREQIEAGPANIWRYRSLLPVPTDIVDSPNMEPGFTRLLRAGNLGRELGIDRLWVKDDSGNPTHSFKDRVVAIALSAARELGSKVFACPSTGNLANAVAAAGARAGIPTVVFIPHDLEVPKIVASAIYTNRLVAVRGNYDDVNRLASEIAGEEDGWAFVNVNVRPVLRRGLQDARLRGGRAARLAAAGQRGDPGGVRVAADQGRQGVPGADPARAGRGEAVPDLRRAGDRLLPGVGRLQGRSRRRPPGAPDDDRQVARDRQPGRRSLRARRRPSYRRRRRGRRRRAGPSRASSCWPAPRASSRRPPAASPSAC